jgi:hypothetical protein
LTEKELRLYLELSDLTRSLDFALARQFFKRRDPKERAKLVSSVRAEFKSFYSRFMPSTEACPDCTPLCCDNGACVGCFESDQ